MSSQRGEFKIVLLGEGRVGKTSILSRFVHDTFNEDERSTTQAAMFSVKAVPIGSSSTAGPSPAVAETLAQDPGSSSPVSPPAPQSVRLAIWDTAGQERFHALAPIYYRNAAGAMLVYDVCDADSLRRVQTWVRELRTVTGDRIRLVVCGNKCDRPASEQEVTPAEALQVADEVGAEHFFTSARTGVNVAEAFSAMAAAVYADAVSVSTGRVGAGGADGGVRGSISARRGEVDDVTGRRRRRRGVVTDSHLDDALFMDYDDDDMGVLGVGGGQAGVGYQGVGGGPTRAGRPLALADMPSPDGAGEGGRRGTPSGGGGCC